MWILNGRMQSFPLHHRSELPNRRLISFPRLKLFYRTKFILEHHYKPVLKYFV